MSLVLNLLLVAATCAPSTRSFLFLVVRPGAPSSVLAPRRRIMRTLWKHLSLSKRVFQTFIHCHLEHSER